MSAKAYQSPQSSSLGASTIAMPSSYGEPALCMQDEVGNQAVLEQLQGQQEPRPAEEAFANAKEEGRTDAGALLTAIIEEPGDTLHIFGEAFVEDELRSFVDGMDLANDIASFSPSPEVQTITTFVTQPMANIVDIYAGVVRGDEDRIQEALADTAVETTVGLVTEKIPLKTSDGRVSPWIVNGSGGIADATVEATTNNAFLNVASDVVVDAAKSIGAKIRGFFGF